MLMDMYIKPSQIVHDVNGVLAGSIYSPNIDYINLNPSQGCSIRNLGGGLLFSSPSSYKA
jgi:hypothetical protein